MWRCRPGLTARLSSYPYSYPNPLLCLTITWIFHSKLYSPTLLFFIFYTSKIPFILFWLELREILTVPIQPPAFPWQRCFASKFTLLFFLLLCFRHPSACWRGGNGVLSVSIVQASGWCTVGLWRRTKHTHKHSHIHTHTETQTTNRMVQSSVQWAVIRKGIFLCDSLVLSVLTVCVCVCVTVWASYTVCMSVCVTMSHCCSSTTVPLVVWPHYGVTIWPRVRGFPSHIPKGCVCVWPCDLFKACFWHTECEVVRLNHNRQIDRQAGRQR